MLYLRENNRVISLAVDLELCDTFLRRLKGAMVSGSIGFSKGYWFPGCRSIHTVMMRSPISLLYYDDRGRVIEYDDFVPPNRFRIGPDRADGVVELAPNRLETHDLSLKDTTLRFPGELCERLDRPDLIFKKSISKFP